MRANLVTGPRVTSMTKWEYLTAPLLVHSTKQILDNFGSDGWELVQVVPGPNPGEPRRLLQASRPVSTPEDRIQELGLTLPEVVPPVAAYLPAVRSGQLVYTAGQLPMRSGSMLHPGKVGAGVDEGQAVEAAQQCALNALAAVKSVVGELSEVKRIVKVVVFVASDPRLHRPTEGRQRSLRAVR